MAKKILAAMPDGSGAVMIDGKMQDDATWKQAKVVVDLAKLVASKEPTWRLDTDFKTVVRHNCTCRSCANMSDENKLKCGSPSTSLATW